MKDRLEAVLDELKRLKREGVTELTVSDEALELLRNAVNGEDVSMGALGASPAVADHKQRERERVLGPYAGSSGQSAASGFKDLMSSVADAASAKHPAQKTSGAAREGSDGALPEPPAITLPDGGKQERWEWLRDRVLNCPVCNEHTHGDYKVVFGVGSIDADIFFCGEAPGGDEEIKGEPFVGRAGQLLTKMIVAMGLKREDVYIGNILNWRPEMEERKNKTSVRQTGNRPPTEAEMKFCLPYLRAQLEVVQPKVIVALGSTAAAGLLGFGSFKSLGAIRGKWHQFNGVPLMVTYHPSYLLRNASNRQKRVVWEDLLQVMEKVDLPINDKQRGYFL